MGLGLKKNKITPPNDLGLINNYNLSGPNNPSRSVDKNTSFSLRPITLENIDEVLFRTFNRRFTIGRKLQDLILLDAEVASYKFQHPENFDKLKEYLNLPYFVIWRNSSVPLYRTSPALKYVTYSVPTQKPQGIVYEDYVTPAPTWLVFPITLKFVTLFREHTNQLEQQMAYYFKNKRNVLILDGERFEIKPSNKDKLGDLEISEREGQGKTLYITTYELEVIGYLRDLKDMQKRERVNTFSVKIVEKTEGVREGEETIVGETEMRIKD